MFVDSKIYISPYMWQDGELKYDLGALRQTPFWYTVWGWKPTNKKDHDLIYCDLDIDTPEKNSKIGKYNVYIIAQGLQDAIHNNFLNQLPDLVFKDIRSGKCKLIIANTSEQWGDLIKFYSSFLKQVKDLNLPTDSIVIFDSTTECLHNKKFNDTEIEIKYSVYLFEIGACLISNPLRGDAKCLTKIELDYHKSVKPRKYYYVSYNGRYMPERHALVKFLKQKKYDNMGYLSWHGDENKIELDSYRYDSSKDEMEYLKYIHENKLKMVWPNIYVSKHYENSYFNILTESQYEISTLEWKGIFFSEKILRPIVNCQPFLVIGQKNILKTLKEFGFKTFDGWIDETYDSCNDEVRCEYVLNEVDKLCSMSRLEIYKWYLSIWKVLEHNFNHLNYEFLPKHRREFIGSFYA
jgi:hypothetical protein